MNIIKKIILTLICLILLVSFINANYFLSSAAINISSKFGGSINTDANPAKDATKTIIGTILQIVRMIAAGVAMVVIIVIACKYMLSSAGDRAEMKKYAMNYIIGAFILLGASGIVTLIKGFIDKALE